MAQAIKAGYYVYARELHAPLGGALTEDALLKGRLYQWNHQKNGGRFNLTLDTVDRAMIRM